MSLQSWFRLKKFRHWNASLIWKGFIKTLPWIGKGLLWQVGNGTEVRVGVDPIVGLGCSYILPDELRYYLEDYGICTLDQARNHTTRFWFSAEELDLCEEWSNPWKLYIRGLEFNRIRLKEETDSLLWSFSYYVGPISAAKGYGSLFHINNLEEQNLVLISLWTLKISLKLICFCWLLVNDRILTWDHLQSRG